MKRTITFLWLLLVLLITSCASSVGYLFTNIAPSQGGQPKIQLKEEDSWVISALALEDTTTILQRHPDANLLTASTASQLITKAATFPQKKITFWF